MMGSTYREITPSPNLAPFVECFWTGDIFKDFSAHLLPDGCADILFITRKNELIETQVVGCGSKVTVSAKASWTGPRVSTSTPATAFGGPSCRAAALLKPTATLMASSAATMHELEMRSTFINSVL
jgi:hypothetical protein